MSVITVIVSVMMSMFAIAASADSDYKITFRVESPNENLYFDTVSVPSDGSLTAAEALQYLDEKSDDLEFTGADTGYISAVNGIAAGKFGGWDGWYYAVNNEAPSVGISDFSLSNGDSLVLYYGGYPCQIPNVDTSKLDSDGIIKFTSNDTEYDENWNPSVVVNGVADATVTVNSDEYTTNSDGEITIPSGKLESTMTLQIEKKDSTGAPAVLRLEPSYTVSCNVNTTSDTDSSSTDSDKDTATDTDSDKNTSSNASSTSSTAKVTTTTTTTKSTTTTTAATASQTAADAAQTGDGRIYMAVGVFVIAIVIVVIMLLLKNKSNKKDE